MPAFSLLAKAGALTIALAGCAAWKPRETPPASPPTPLTDAARPAATPPAAASQEAPAAPPTAAPPPPADAPRAARKPAPTAAPPRAAATAPSAAARGKAAAGAKPRSPPVAAAAAVAPAPVKDKPDVPSLDLASLEQRLKDTHAIGVFTKLSLKNQVDDLLDQFRTFHRGAGKDPPAALRSQYDLLMLKVLSLLQDSDPQLAASIASSREAIWGILKDPDKFAKI